ncbi:endonuclease [Flavobacterium silvaticum]|uniref:T9SS type A sorting domain-containing protein n=1 Tax=Flavobacterium silvaticum TaxID=1852020 RepID=A0A972JF64_9FLAO|nr:endonuclease [Flavobacterium silvaticum]NMH26906.1 T9SS type A sorting domain-containing protein [Flavobacterium silvaticum]
MIKKIICVLSLLWFITANSQVVISELDTDTPGTDDMEFVELKTDVPNFSLDGYVLVFFNGSATASDANKSYYVIDLDGLQSDINGNLLLGSANVSPVPAYILPNSVIQNGADGIGLYLGNASDFPDETLATQTNLVDALVYGTSDPDATALMALLGVSSQIDENLNSLGTTQSIQRKTDGTYEVKAPTPGVNNDGSGFDFNGLLITTSAAEFNEGQSFTITFTLETASLSNLTIDFSLENGTFNDSDFTGDTSVTIPAGQLSAVVTIQLVDDNLDEGDEVLKIHVSDLPFGYIRLNDNIERYVIDNDFTVSAWGTPLNPTYGIVSSTAPAGYYDSLEGKSGDQLKQAMQDIIADPSVVHAQNYGDIEFMLKEADQNPLNSNQVWLMYVEQGRGKYKFQSTASNTGSWNREHIFPQSRGGFTDGTDSVADGIDIWQTTNADDIDAGHGDGHHIRAEDGPENSSRNNRDYGEDYNGPAGNQGSWHGDVARSLFYMAVRYNALSLVTGNPADTTLHQMGDLTYLLDWNHSDPSDDFEMHRNNVIYVWQKNRNPFIDHPELADYIWGIHAGEAWFSNLSAPEVTRNKIVLYPNPSNGNISVYGIQDGTIEIFDMTGSKLLEKSLDSTDNSISMQLSSGIYLAKISSGGISQTQKLIIR